MSRHIDRPIYARKIYPLDLYFICSTSLVARELARLAHEGVIKSVYRSEDEARDAYWRYPPTLRNRYGGFHVVVQDDGTISKLVRINGFILAGVKPKATDAVAFSTDDWER